MIHVPSKRGFPFTVGFLTGRIRRLYSSRCPTWGRAKWKAICSQFKMSGLYLWLLCRSEILEVNCSSCIFWCHPRTFPYIESAGIGLRRHHSNPSGGLTSSAVAEAHRGAIVSAAKPGAENDSIFYNPACCCAVRSDRIPDMCGEISARAGSDLSAWRRSTFTALSV